MEKMIDLKDLLKHEIMDLYSAEEQIIEALPAMIDNANNGSLKKALQEHLKITEKQKLRLDEIKQALAGDEDADNESLESAEGANEAVSPEKGMSSENNETSETPAKAKKPGFFSRLFGGQKSGEKCKGMEGLITEGNKMMGEDMSPEVLDAAIIASAQKIEHYEISGYGTARAFARELSLDDVYNKLTETLNEEYEADDRLTALAVGKLNNEAEEADGLDNRGRRPGQRQSSGGNASKAGKPNNQPSGSKSASKNSPSKSSSKGSSSKGSSSKGSSSKGSSSKSSSSKGSSSKGFSSKGSSAKGSSSKGSSSKGSSSKGSSSKGSSSKGLSKSSNKSSGGRSSSTGRGSSSKGFASKGNSAKSSKSSSKGSSKSGANNSKSSGKGSGAKSSPVNKGGRKR